MFDEILENLPQRATAYDGRKARNVFTYYRVGRIQYGSKLSEHIPIGDIIVSDRQIVHIRDQRKKYIHQLIKKIYPNVRIDNKSEIDMTFEYIKQAVANYDGLLKDEETGVYLLLHRGGIKLLNDNHIHGAIFELCENVFGEDVVYTIKTVHPFDWDGLKKYKWLCDIPRS